MKICSFSNISCSMIKEIIKYFFGKRNSEFNVLKASLSRWNNGRGDLGFLNVEQSFQMVFAKYYEEYFKDFKIYFSESLEKIVADNPNYPDRSVFQEGGRYFEPDLCVVNKDGIIKEIVEINAIVGGRYSVIFSKSGGRGFNGDIIKLKNIKNRYPEIDCYQLIIKRLDLGERDWGEDLINDLIDNECIRMEVVAIFNQKIRLELYSITEKIVSMENFFNKVQVPNLSANISFNG